jgi:hypothetical protein
MTRMAAAFLALALAPTAAAADDDPPLRKPGLWEVTTTREGGAAMPKAQMCTDASTQAQWNGMGKGMRKEMDCSKREAHRAGAVFTMDSVCKFMGSTQTTHVVVTSVSENEYTMEMAMHADPPRKYGKPDTKMAQRGQWLGPCPADMKPGDMKISGHTFHPGAKP